MLVKAKAFKQYLACPEQHHAKQRGIPRFFVSSPVRQAHGKQDQCAGRLKIIGAEVGIVFSAGNQRLPEHAFIPERAGYTKLADHTLSQPFSGNEKKQRRDRVVIQGAGFDRCKPAHFRAQQTSERCPEQRAEHGPAARSDHEKSFKGGHFPYLAIQRIQYPGQDHAKQKHHHAAERG